MDEHHRSKRWFFFKRSTLMDMNHCRRNNNVKKYGPYSKFISKYAHTHTNIHKHTQLNIILSYGACVMWIWYVVLIYSLSLPDFFFSFRFIHSVASSSLPFRYFRIWLLLLFFFPAYSSKAVERQNRISHVFITLKWTIPFFKVPHNYHSSDNLLSAEAYYCYCCHHRCRCCCSLS